MERAGLGRRFEVKAVAGELLETIKLSQKSWQPGEEQEFLRYSGKLEQFSRFRKLHYEQHREQIGSREGYEKLAEELEELARRCATTGEATEAETETLRSFFECRQDIVNLLSAFAPVCEQLAQLAQKSLAGEALTEDGSRTTE